MLAIFRSTPPASTHTPVLPGLARARDPEPRERVDDEVLEPAEVGDEVAALGGRQPHEVADDLSRPVPRDVAAALDRDDLVDRRRGRSRRARRGRA